MDDSLLSEDEELRNSSVFLPNSQPVVIFEEDYGSGFGNGVPESNIDVNESRRRNSVFVRPNLNWERDPSSLLSAPATIPSQLNIGREADGLSIGRFSHGISQLGGSNYGGEISGSNVYDNDDVDSYGDAPGQMFERTSSESSIFDNERSSEVGDDVPMNEEMEQQEKRESIIKIMGDKSLTPLERRRSIQGLMDGRVRKNSIISTTTTEVAADLQKKDKTPEEMEKSRPPCTHYKRNCTIISPCCGLAFGCRVCHDEYPDLPPPFKDNDKEGKQERRLSSMTDCSESHTIDRYKIEEVICRKCYTRQSSKTNNCIKCNIQFGEYHCSICNLWMSIDEQPYHCPDCGFCRLGGSKNYVHCHDCGICIDAQLIDSHECKKGKYMSNCPICQEDLFSSRAASHELPCGHAMHWHCFQEYSSFDSRCPVCKKTSEDPQDMKETWEAMALTIEMQPIPTEFARVVNISCNDCEQMSLNCRWHLIGVQCKHCNSFNTNVEATVLTDQQAVDFFEQMEDGQEEHSSSSVGDEAISLDEDSQTVEYPSQNMEHPSSIIQSYSDGYPTPHDNTTTNSTNNNNFNESSYDNSMQQPNDMDMENNHSENNYIDMYTNDDDLNAASNNYDSENVTSTMHADDVTNNSHIYIPPNWNPTNNPGLIQPQQLPPHENAPVANDDTSDAEDTWNGIYVPSRWRYDIPLM